MNELYIKYRWKGVGVLSVFLTTYILFTVFVPQVNRLFDTYSSIQGQKEKINTVANWESKLESYNAKLKRLEKFSSKLFVSVSSNDEMSAIVEMVYSHGQDSGVDVQSMEPLESVDRKVVTEIPVLIMASGEFHAIIDFVNSLEQANHLIQVSRLDIRSNSKEDRMKLSAKIQLNVMIIRKNS